MSRPFQTDALNPGAIPSASSGRLGRTNQPLSSSARTFELPVDNLVPGSRYTAELKKTHEDWNAKIDKEVKGLAKGLKELVDLADIGTNATASSSPLPLQLRLSSLIRSTQTLRDMTHELKLLLLLSDQVSAVDSRDKEVRSVRREVNEKRQEVAREIAKLYAGDKTADNADGRPDPVDDGRASTLLEPPGHEPAEVTGEVEDKVKEDEEEEVEDEEMVEV
ncbi:hypothetical protein BD324DRAFT_683646 [Kockovaella imperatae]|uniref:Uncharacterized protein n=1 Tax=Kockovaella imperatae TaxID=4999 RepID=A0A1Y1U856_9TREE|nr:hypothetical protein BD324DRAFT_683646 [Kockovaella imperatae]ORX34219.1 hypothetical protein BD324DRAFT_683646 [Kockovaella imperatae]